MEVSTDGQDVHPNQIDELQVQAQALGDDPVKLKRRLYEVRDVLNDELRGLKGDWEFDYGHKRLLHKSGKYALVWRLRDDPDRPPDYDNQQTSRGAVLFTHI